MYHLIDRIYEAAFVPDMWPIALDDLAMSGSVGGALLVASEAHPPRFAALASIANALREFSSGDAWRNNDRPMRWRPSLDGFLRDIDLLSPEDLEADPMRDELVKYGLGWQAGNDHAMTNGEVVVYSVERCFQDGPHDSVAVASLKNGHVSHFKE